MTSRPVAAIGTTRKITYVAGRVITCIGALMNPVNCVFPVEIPTCDIQYAPKAQSPMERTNNPIHVQGSLLGPFHGYSP